MALSTRVVPASDSSVSAILHWCTYVHHCICSVVSLDCHGSSYTTPLKHQEAYLQNKKADNPDDTFCYQEAYLQNKKADNPDDTFCYLKQIGDTVLMGGAWLVLALAFLGNCNDALSHSTGDNNCPATTRWALQIAKSRARSKGSPDATTVPADDMQQS